MRIVAFALVAALAVPAAASAAEGLFNYYPTNDAARRLTDRGLTFIFDKALFGGVRMKQIRAVEASAAAELAPVSERDIGGRLDDVIGKQAPERDLYLIKTTEQGPAMVRAFCPGSTKAWLAFGAIRARRDARFHAIGDDPATGKPKLCATLDFRFRGEWKAPPMYNRNPFDRPPDRF